ncbi:hypothetical protein [Acinetobacter tibetensis]|uniref:Uncharacterized protein n=1 Tax=Acinetobacter tibetensis TaxID=2943497 RepID=A0AAE9LQF4_9GAMM|nr:hypothetical protein [Acinetobacter tibetensis]USE82691.1 hypothetical protein M5E07_12990 [Acinetobacter tibetensis]
MTIKEFFDAEVVEIDEPAILISINKTVDERSIYDAARFAWKLKLEEAEKAELIFAITRGVIRGVFIAKQWLPATEDNFPNFHLINEEVYTPTLREKRFGFIGHAAPEYFQEKYLGKKIPEKFRRRGASNPIKYSWKAKD